MDEKERKIIRTNQLIIDGNVMKYTDSVIQMTNVARCEVAPMPDEPYPRWAFGGMILGMLFLFLARISIGFVIFGLVVMAVCVGVLVYIYMKNQDMGMYLILELNSGKMLFFTCYNLPFLKDVQEAIIDCFNYSGVSRIINFNECTITDTQIGEHNEVKYQ